MSSGGNLYDKYHTKNPVYKLAVNRFLGALEMAVKETGESKTLLDVGCGEGYLLSRISAIKRFTRIEGIDISESVIEKARARYPLFRFSAGSACDLSYRENEFDLVMACETLEHIENYEKALLELKRVSEGYVIVSVPVEPLWRILNCARGAYISSLGNTPGHINHWTKKGFISLLECHFKIEKLYYPLPWQLALCSK